MIDPVALYDELALGRRKLRSIFCASTTQTLKANEKFAGAARPAGAVYRLHAGWACQFRELSNGGRAIVDVYVRLSIEPLAETCRRRVWRPETR
jgi:hypothetical protein